MELDPPKPDPILEAMLEAHGYGADWPHHPQGNIAKSVAACRGLVAAETERCIAIAVALKLRDYRPGDQGWDALYSAEVALRFSMTSDSGFLVPPKEKP